MNEKDAIFLVFFCLFVTGFGRIQPIRFINPLKLSFMELKDLLRTGTNVSVTVSLEDLKQLFKEVAGSTLTAEALSPAEEY